MKVQYLINSVLKIYKKNLKHFEGQDKNKKNKNKNLTFQRSLLQQNGK
jgi:hypothetical protein